MGLRQIVSASAVAAIAATATYSFLIKGYSPLTFPQELAWNAYTNLAAYAQGAKKVWMVVEFTSGNGAPGQMSFDNPAVPDATMADC